MAEPLNATDGIIQLTLLGEDSLSKFTTQHPIEMYIEDAEGGFQGEKEIMSQFGLENRNEITFVVSKQRFQQMDSQITSCLLWRKCFRPFMILSGRRRAAEIGRAHV